VLCTLRLFLHIVRYEHLYYSAVVQSVYDSDSCLNLFGFALMYTVLAQNVVVYLPLNLFDLPFFISIALQVFSCDIGLYCDQNNSQCS